MNDNVLTKDCGVLADAMQSVRRSLKMADRLADGYIPRWAASVTSPTRTWREGCT